MSVLDKTDLQNIAKEQFLCSGTVWHVSKSGNDSTGDGLSWGTAYLTVAKAVSVMSAGDVINVGKGLFDESTTSLVFIDGMIVGQGWQTIIQGSNTAGSGAIFDVRGNCKFKNLRINSNIVSNGTTFNYPIYLGTDQTNVFMEDCWISGVTDCLYKPNGVTTIAGYAQRCLLTTAWDWIATRGGNQTFELVDCRCISTGPTGATGAQASTGMDFRGTSCNARFVRTYFEAGNDPYANIVLAMNVGTAQFIDSHIRVYGTGTRINLQANASTIILSGNSSYDPAYAPAPTNGGSIIRVAGTLDAAGTSPINLSGKVLGGGSSSISGVGVNANMVQLMSNAVPVDSSGFPQTDMVRANGASFILLPNLTAGTNLTPQAALSGTKVEAFANYPLAQPFSLAGVDLTGWGEMVFIVKGQKPDADAASVIEIKLTNGGAPSDGLLLLNGLAPVSPVSATDGSISNVVLTGGGSPTATWNVNITATAMAEVTNGQYWWEWAWWKGGVKQSYQGTGPFTIGQTLVNTAVQP